MSGSSDQYSAGLDRVLNDILRRLSEIERRAGIVAGQQIVAASGAFNVPSTSEPSSPASGFKIWSNAGDFRLKHSNGVVRGFPAGAVSNHSATSSTVSNPPTQAQVNAIRSDVLGVSTTVNALLSSLRAVGLLNT